MNLIDKPWDRHIDILTGYVGSTRSMNISKLHMSFVVQDGFNTDSTAQIIVKNLDKLDLEILRKSDIITVTAGHKTGNEPRIIFSGKVESIQSTVEGGDTSHFISCTGGTVARSIQVAESYDDKTPVLDIMKSLAKKTGLPLEVSERVIKKIGLKIKKALGGMTVAGKAVDEIEEIASDNGLETRIDNVSIKLVEKNSVDRKRALVLSPRAGLLVDLQESEIDEDGVKRSGFTFTSLLYPELQRSSTVEVKESIHPGTYRVVNRTHKGSNFESEFSTICEVVPV